MREIKFRVWHKPTNQFVRCHPTWNDKQYKDLGLLSLTSDGELIFETMYDGFQRLSYSNEADDFIVQQYTGLKDKNGQEIYEGDILGYPESLDDKTLYEIRWARAYSGEQWCEFRIQNISGDSIQDTEPHDYYGGISQNDYKIVVGNIFEGVDE